MDEKKLAEVRAANRADPVSGIDPKKDGHESLADLFREIRADEAAGKREEAHLPAHMQGPQKDGGMER